MNRKFIAFKLGLIAITGVVVTGCGVLNTAENADFACPGMPLGVTCKTPAAVFRSSNNDLPVTDFDTPMGTKALAAGGASYPMSTPEAKAPVVSDANVVGTSAGSVSKGPRPVREAAKVVRIWIAPWVDREDNLHLAQTQYTEVTPRTWTVGIEEVKSGSGYVIPHTSFNNIPLPADAGKNTNDRPAGRSSEAQSSVSIPPLTPNVK